MEAIVYFNGSLMPLSQARISPLDYGFLYGYGLFETMRAYNGHVFRLNKHMARLGHSAQILGVELDGVPSLEKAVHGTLRANQLSDARIRLTVSGGEEESMGSILKAGEPTIFITAGSYVPPSEEVYHRGFTAIVSRIRRSSRSPGSSLKSLSYLDILLARQEAAAAGVDHAIMLNDDGLVAEGTTSNIFYAKNDRLFTPAEHSGILPGVTREVVIREAAPALGIEVTEADVSLADLLGADEAFLTNSMFEIMPLTVIANRGIGSGRPGALTQRLMEAYKTLVGKSMIEHGRTGEL